MPISLDSVWLIETYVGIQTQQERELDIRKYKRCSPISIQVKDIDTHTCTYIHTRTETQIKSNTVY